jgi:hypothetical protein
MRDDGRRRHRIAAFTGVLVVLLSRAASSAENGPVTLVVDACPDVSKAEIERILDIELRTIAAGKQEVEVAPTRLTATCDRDRVSLHAVVARGDKSLFQTVSLAGAADENERLIAIAAAELVFSAWVSASLASADRDHSSPTAKARSSSGKAPPGPASGATARDPASRARAARRRLPLKVEIGPLWRRYRRGPSHFFGGELSLRWMPLGPLHLRAGVAVEGMVVQRPVGRVSLFAVSGAAAAGVTTPVLKFLVAGAEVGGRFGLARLKGESSDESVETGRVGGGFGGPLLGFFVGSSTNPYALLTAELGYAFYGNVGHLETSRIASTIDIWVSLGLAIGFSF